MRVGIQKENPIIGLSSKICSQTTLVNNEDYVFCSDDFEKFSSSLHDKGKKGRKDIGGIVFVILVCQTHIAEFFRGSEKGKRTMKLQTNLVALKHLDNTDVFR